MNFTVSTKPLADALSLGIVNANVSKFYMKSCIAQVSAESNILKINLEASYIISELRLKGSPDEEIKNSPEGVSVFVDSLLLKQLVATIETSTVTLEFAENGLVIHSGKSKFTLPKMLDSSELRLAAPSLTEGATSIKIDNPSWKFIKDNQMYAIAMSFIHPVYTNVWLGDSSDVLVGDFDNSLFTHSQKNTLGSRCLLSDTIINLFNSLPEGASLFKEGENYVINVATDGFEFLAQFTPRHESDEDVGSYNAEMILEMMKRSPDTAVKVNPGIVNKFLSQAALLSTKTDDTITLGIGNGHLILKDKNVDCSVAVEGAESADAYQVDFKTDLLKSVISTYSDESIFVSPFKQGEVVVGIVVWNKDLTTVLAGVG